MGNKGGVSIYMKILDTSFIFTNAHLAAGKSVTRRNKNYQLINAGTPKKLFPKSRKSLSMSTSASQNMDAKSDSKMSDSSPNKRFSLSKSLKGSTDTSDDTSDVISPMSIDECADRVIWMGDLNYRINGERKMMLALIERKKHEVLLNNDQLRYINY